MQDYNPRGTSTSRKEKPKTSGADGKRSDD